MPPEVSFDDLLRDKVNARREFESANADVKRANDRRTAACDAMYAADEAIAKYIAQRTNAPA